MRHAPRMTPAATRLGRSLLFTHRPYLGTLGVGLAVQAAVVAGAWWLIPALAFLGWSWNARDLQGTAIALGLGLIGTAWTTIGVSLIPLAPGQFALPGAVWIALALLMASASHIARKRGSKGL